MFNFHRLKLFSIFLLFSAATSHAIAQGMAGKWQGTLEVSAKGKKPAVTWQYELQLEEFGETVKGTARISSPGNKGETYKYAVMEVTGTFVNNVLTFKEVKIISQEGFADPLEWCLKSGSLELLVQHETAQLIGRWTGKNGSGDCLPGTINVLKMR